MVSLPVKWPLFSHHNLILLSISNCVTVNKDTYIHTWHIDVSIRKSMRDSQKKNPLILEKSRTFYFFCCFWKTLENFNHFFLSFSRKRIFKEKNDTVHTWTIEEIDSNIIIFKYCTLVFSLSQLTTTYTYTYTYIKWIDRQMKEVIT